MRNNFPKRLFLMLLGIFLFSVACFADESKTEGIQGIEFLTGFQKGKLHAKGDFIMTPFMVDIDFDLKPLTKKIGINPASLLQFQLEPYISPIYAPDTNVEIGNAFIIKAGILPETSKIQPYVKAGLGMLYMTQATREQSTQFNFFETLGVGMHYFFSKKTAFTLEYRYRHVSNSGIKSPNQGINSQFALLGLAYQF